MAAAVSAFDASCAVLASGLLALWMGLTDAMLKYLKPSMRPWLVVAGAVLVAVGTYGLARTLRREAAGKDEEPCDSHTRRHRVGWLLAVPVAVMLALGSQSLGAFAAGRASNRALPAYSFDIAAYADAQGDDVPTLQLVDVKLGAGQRGNREYLERHLVRLEGFVTHDDSLAPGGFMLTRFLVGCCAADATPLSIAMTGADHVPPEEQWVAVTARLQGRDAIAAAPTGSSRSGTTMRVHAMERIDEPSGPYETLR
jgi:uncharacterized repeat protein (TIGR03943 family)